MTYKEQIDLNLKSAEWIADEVTQLLNEHKKCRTKSSKALIVKKLRAIEGKLKHEGRVIDSIIEGEK